MILDKSRLYLSALSGGADSTALLLLLIEKGYKVEAVHCNFHLRGEESDRDERFCQKLCDDNGVKLHIAHFDTVSYAAMHQESIETAARNLRYNYFFQLVGDLDAAGICVAHNRNDQAETVLMKLIRGAGIHGLSGMKPVTHVEFRGNDVAIYRPLLTKSRQWIEEYLRQRGQGWVDDSTNFEDEATRNKFRLNIIPMIEKINPSAVENIAKAADRLQEVAEIYDSSVDRSKKRITSKDKYLHIDVKALLEEIAPEAVLFEILNPYGFNGPQIEDIIRHISSSREGCESSPTAHGQGKEWTSKSHRALLDRGDIIVGKNDENADFEMRFPEEGNYSSSRGFKISIVMKPWDTTMAIPHSSNSICLDSAAIRFPLTMRSLHRGDRFVPFGMKGSKLVSDFLTDQKVSLMEKRQQMVLCDATGRILWVVGRRPDNRFRITTDTKECMAISFKKN